MAIQPIFIFSITRSGSTLVQRVIAAHEGVATVSEPWLLLPFVYTMREEGVVAEYTHWLMARAIEDFYEQLPGRRDAYREELRLLAMRLYERAAGEGARFFVDKSPPYYFIVNEIIDLFPDGKFVFLFRNPLSILSSIIDTWNDGKLYMSANREDLFIGLPRTISAYDAHRDRAHSIRYEDVVGGDEHHWGPRWITWGSSSTRGRWSASPKWPSTAGWATPPGRHEYVLLNSDPVAKWSRTLRNPILWKVNGRGATCASLGPTGCRVMGYDQAQLLAELDALQTGTEKLGGDFLRLLNDVAGSRSAPAIAGGSESAARTRCARCSDQNPAWHTHPQHRLPSPPAPIPAHPVIPSFRCLSSSQPSTGRPCSRGVWTACSRSGRPCRRR